MKQAYTVSLSRIIKEHSLTPLYLPMSADEILIDSAEVNRPGLTLAGFFELFEPSRIQILGRAEYQYLRELSPEEREITHGCRSHWAYCWVVGFRRSP